MMEAMRILKTRRRSSRAARSASALWGGEEQGLLGSQRLRARHFADPATMAAEAGAREARGLLQLDNGTGKIRGIWLQGNTRRAPIFEAWMEPLADLGVTTLGPRAVVSDRSRVVRRRRPARASSSCRTGSNTTRARTTRTWTSTIASSATTWCSRRRSIAVFAYNAAMRDEKLPRKPLPSATTAPAR